MSKSEQTEPSSGTLWWPAAGAALGLAAAAYGLLERAPSESLPESAIARVNDALIGTGHYERTVERLETLNGASLSREDRQRVLEQLIEEELLVQRGIDLGLTESEPSVRTAIVQSLVASVTAEADAADPSDADLAQFLDDHSDRYTYASATKVAAWVTDDERLAQQFSAAIRNLGTTQAPPDGVRPVPGIPDSPLPLARLRMFLGPAIAAAVTETPPDSTNVYARQGRWYIVSVVAHADSVRAELAAVRSQVLVDYRRDLADRALSSYIQRLLLDAEVVTAAPR